MATHYNGTVGCVVPLSHKCSKCCNKVISTIPLSEDYFVTYYNGLRESRQEQLDRAKAAATSRLRTKIDELYTDTPLNSTFPIIGECKKCGHKERWQKTQKENYSSSPL